MITTHDQGHRAVAAGRSVYWQAWLPQDPAQAVVIVVHGIHEHSARYAHVGLRLAAAGFAVYAADHRGHGRSGGRRANIERMALVLADLRSFVRFAAARHPGLPVFMVGHSLGGLIALHCAIDLGAIDLGAINLGAIDLRAIDLEAGESGAAGPGSTLDGLVLSGPAMTTTTGLLARRLAEVLSALVPNLGVTDLGATEKISRDPDVVRAYRQDPLVYRGRIKARTGAEILAAMQRLPARLPLLSIPLLILHGTADQICPVAGSTTLHELVSSPDKTLRRYPGLYHEVFNEPEREAILTDLIRWLNDHLPTNRPPAHSAG